MCGIAGICHIDGPNDVSLDTVKSMVGVLHHRGPDEAGIYLDDRVGLGSCALLRGDRARDSLRAAKVFLYRVRGYEAA